MIDITDPIVKKIIQNMHNAIERKNKNLLSSFYDDYVLENRALKLFCANKNLDPRRCAEEMNDRYNSNLDYDDIIKILKANRLTYQSKRADLLNWAEEMVAAFAKALETRKPEDYQFYEVLRNKNIYNNNNERYRIQERMVCLMLYVKHPELDSGLDAESAEKFGNVYMKHLLAEFTDFLKNICFNMKPKDKIKDELTLKDFIVQLYTKYPELYKELAAEVLKELENVRLKIFIDEIIEDKNFEQFAEDRLLEELTEYNNSETLQTEMTIEEFLQNDPDAETILISPKNITKPLNSDKEDLLS